MRWCTLVFLVACYRSHGVGDEHGPGDEGVACPDEPCVDGNACTVCGSTRRCDTLDLSTDEACRTFVCDGDEDCESGQRCELENPRLVSCVVAE